MTAAEADAELRREREALARTQAERGRAALRLKRAQLALAAALVPPDKSCPNRTDPQSLRSSAPGAHAGCKHSTRYGAPVSLGKQSNDPRVFSATFLVSVSVRKSLPSAEVFNSKGKVGR